MKKRNLFIHAINIHQGGGSVLLSSFLHELPCNINIIANLDSRMVLDFDISKNIQVNYFKNSIISRFFSEVRLFRNAAKNDLIFCFGSLPPLLPSKTHSIVFVQNRYVIDKFSLKNLPLNFIVRIQIERLWFYLASPRVYKFIVQTPSMFSRMRLINRLKDVPINVLPFILDVRRFSRKLEKFSSKMITGNFCYIASGEPHKNHQKLIEAWVALAKEGIFPSLTLTLDRERSPHLINWILQQKSIYKLKVTNIGHINHSNLLSVYRKHKALIFPSKFESFGLPLVEARQANLSILASELDYVRDLVDPEETFNPFSAESIAMAVKRFMNIPEAKPQLIDTKKFISFILKEFSELENINR
jgi:glycosyltransferase involved in cell wall biosynthesis